MEKLLKIKKKKEIDVEESRNFRIEAKRKDSQSLILANKNLKSQPQKQDYL